MSKKYLFILSSLVIFFLLVACGSDEVVNNDSNGINTESSNEDEEESMTDFPQRPIEIYVGFEAGGSADVLARTMVELSKEYVAEELAVINTPGAVGTVALNEIMTSKPDGYKIILTPTGPLNVTPHFGDVSFDPVDDFEPIINLASSSFFFAVPEDSPYETVEEIINSAQENPDQIYIGTTGVRSIPHIFLEAMAVDIDAEFKHVPFDGDAPARAALLGGNVDGIILPESSIIPYVGDGELRALAYLGSERHSSLSDIPTVQELGYDDLTLPTPSFNFFVLGPKDLPMEVRNIIHDIFKQAMEDPAADEKFENIQQVKHYMSPDDLAKLIQNDSEAFKRIISEAGID